MADLKKTSINRLEKVASFLDALPRKNFVMREFVSKNATIECLSRLSKIQKKVTCGTAACAIGWLPAIFKRNWKWAEYKNFEGQLMITTYLKHNDQSAVDYGYLGAMQFFKIDMVETRYLFDPSYYRKNGFVKEPTPKQVAARIRSFVKSGLPQELNSVYLGTSNGRS